MMYVWLILAIIFVVAECMTVGLVSIWFAGGALTAMLLSMAGANVVWQAIAFLVVSAVLLVATRPLVKKYLLNKKTKTNYESVIGEVAKVIETIDNYNQTGAAFADGKEWTARSISDVVVLEKGSLVKVTAVEGVKLIVEPYEIQQPETAVAEDK
ncbi:MAG: NfeD family protein [Lachnospiraceae bacterium]|nr:NfeD family protein [Lachnospiraceae bacterium]MBP3578771.1 NfeD family protein [Lachnospiraceae bacterium]